MQRTQAPFRADVVGSLLRPAAIKQARQRFADGERDAAQLRAVEDNEIARVVVAEQRALGLQVVTDGEFRRAWWHMDFFEGLDGGRGLPTRSGNSISRRTNQGPQRQSYRKTGF